MNRADRSEAISTLFPDIVVDENGITAVFTPHADHEGQPGWVQGGFIATVLDYVCAHAATEAFGTQAITGNLTLRYGLPVLLKGGPYQIKAVVATGSNTAARSSPRRTLRIDGLVVSPGGESLVTASGLFVRRISTS